MWILQEAQSGKVAVVDPSEAEPVAKALEAEVIHSLDTSDCGSLDTQVLTCIARMHSFAHIHDTP